jgi:thiamine-phosphate pyrophosphorylase
VGRSRFRPLASPFPELTLAFRLLAIGDRRTLSGLSLPEWAAAVAAAGVPAVQLREKDLPDGACLALGRMLRAAVRPPAALWVNGRVDVALACGADGVHLPSDGVPVRAVRERWPSRLLVGRAAHDLAEVAAAAADGADYVTFGPVFASPGKGSGVGLAALARASAVGIPVVALGGVGIAQLREVAAAGAAGAAGIRLFQDLDRLPEAIGVAREAFAS